MDLVEADPVMTQAKGWEVEMGMQLLVLGWATASVLELAEGVLLLVLLLLLRAPLVELLECWVQEEHCQRLGAQLWWSAVLLEEFLQV
jgi:Leu/Phe-tRNA-protein transferase